MADGALQAYLRIAAAQARGQAQYRLSFLLDVVFSVLTGVLDTVTVVVMFRVTRTLGGFDFPATFLMAALAGLGFSLADLSMGNIEQLGQHVRRGTLDVLLIRPLSALFQLAVLEFAPRRIGRAGQSLVVLALALYLAPVRWTAPRLALLLVTPLAGALLFAAMFVATAAASFWWTEVSEFASSFTYGGRDFTAYPVTVYGPWFRRLFAFGLGFAFVGYYPALALLGRADPLGLPASAGWASPLVGLVAAALAGGLWRLGVRHYRSTGS